MAIDCSAQKAYRQAASLLSRILRICSRQPPSTNHPSSGAFATRNTYECTNFRNYHFANHQNHQKINFRRNVLSCIRTKCFGNSSWESCKSHYLDTIFIVQRFCKSAGNLKNLRNSLPFRQTSAEFSPEFQRNPGIREIHLNLLRCRIIQNFCRISAQICWHQ